MKYPKSSPQKSVTKCCIQDQPNKTFGERKLMRKGAKNHLFILQQSLL